MLMYTGKDPTTNQGVDPRIGITARDVYPFFDVTTLVPLNRNPMRSIL